MKTQAILVFGIVAGMLLCAPVPVCADHEVEELKKQIQVLQQRVDELEAQRQQPQAPVARPGGASGWDPFFEMERIREEMNRMFENSFDRRGMFGQGMPSMQMDAGQDIELKEVGNAYVVTVDTRGFNKNKLDVEINKFSITVKGEHSSEQSEEGQGRYFKARSFGSFLKTIPLPVDADTGRAKTEQKGDQLVITVPKKKS